MTDGRCERLRRPWLAGALIVLAATAGGCDRAPARTASGSEPFARSVPATTSGAIATRNLESQLRSAERRHTRNPKDPHALGDLTELLLARAQYLGRLGDYDRANELASELVSTDPGAARSWLLRASARAALHEFDGALADLDRAAELGASPAALAAARADVLEATGQTEAALTLRERAVTLRSSVTAFAALATSRALGGDEAQATALFEQALGSYRDVSPFPIAWLLVQRALTWERAGRVDDARAAFALAHERLPVYAAAASGLARLTAASGDHARAARILHEVVATSDDPEYAGQLAGELRALGAIAEADRLRDQAARALDELVARHPAAFVAKQVRFWLGPGGNPERGFAIARENLATSGSSPSALALAAEAALAAQKAATQRRGAG